MFVNADISFLIEINVRFKPSMCNLRNVEECVQGTKPTWRECLEKYYSSRLNSLTLQHTPVIFEFYWNINKYLG